MPEQGQVLTGRHFIQRDKREGRAGGSACEWVCGFGDEKWIEVSSDGFYFLCKMSCEVDNVGEGEKFHQWFEESERMSLVIQDRGKTSLPVSHSRIDQLHGGLWNSV